MAKNQAKEAQQKAVARKASLEDLQNKRPLQKTVYLWSGDEQLEIVVESIGRKAYADLVEACSEEVEQDVIGADGEPEIGEDGNVKQEKTEKLDENEFFPRLVAASLADFDVTVDVVKGWVDEWNASEFDELAMAAFEVNTRNKVAVQGKG